ncbi:protein-export chaperone SecB [Lactiplantibacillus plantarum]|uniref:protein-export chaperone SecB n=1 Tax=Lactiplantibacillus plantarum TaxID=1590 RepID=UPI0021CAF898|nr:protein-export chaperone SecB [Lactiplantibacillus plantarum]MCG0772155.1 preprotein translocase subunit SecB [Lactiplantibacillus plantarum]MDY7131386.1 protein-export chaperone SecB [Lactiplantibacillus plantarum]WMX74213.1 protein-export chaperone SecB [Lactiplantibacillus plantarum]
MSEPIIDFKGYKIQNLQMTRDKIKADKMDKDINIQSKSALTSDKKKAKVILNIQVRKATLVIDLELEGYFEVSNELENSKIAAALAVNGVAILFPYARSVISMISTLDSSEVVVLPTINTLGSQEQ